MEMLCKLRKWINRNDGRLFQVDNSNLGALEVIGYPVCILGYLLLSLAHDKLGTIGSGWAIGCAIVGFVLAYIGILLRKTK